MHILYDTCVQGGGRGRGEKKKTPSQRFIYRAQLLNNASGLTSCCKPWTIDMYWGIQSVRSDRQLRCEDREGSFCLTDQAQTGRDLKKSHGFAR